MKCIIILSEKSSGSSVLHRILTDTPGVNTARWTRHQEMETLYWTKAASVLERPQVKMHQSEVPIERNRARRELIEFLQRNLDHYTPPDDDRDLIFDGWRDLCHQYGPIFCEKSPHHLVQWSNLELILECQQRHPDIEFLLVGLVRNPMDSIYSQFTRWRSVPEKLQWQWHLTYSNLLKLKENYQGQIVTMRYEDLVRSEDELKPIFHFCKAIATNQEAGNLHKSSLAKWRQDQLFGFVLDDEVVALAERFGYEKDELTNRRTLTWPIYRTLACGLRDARQRVGSIKRVLRSTSSG